MNLQNHQKVNLCLEQQMELEEEVVLNMDCKLLTVVSMNCSFAVFLCFWLQIVKLASLNLRDACCFVEGVITCCCLAMVDKKMVQICIAQVVP